MGFFKTCWDFIRYALPFTTLNDGLNSQQPVTVPVASNDDNTLTFHPDGASPNFRCHYPDYKADFTFCNSESTRDCWISGVNSDFDIRTDYETTWPTGFRRDYWLVVEDKAIAPDGYLKTDAKVVNGTYPGPLIEACWGDQIFVHVKNNVSSNGTTIHWHGIRQLNSTDADGVNGVTQCPIATGEEYIYAFNATQYGYTWYHSHYSLQYPDGVAGKLLIHGPTNAPWDESLGQIFINDWSHNSAFRDFFVNLNYRIPSMDSILIDGHGHWSPLVYDPDKPADPGAPILWPHNTTIFEKVLTKGKRYLLHIVNAGTEAPLFFSIDDHQIEVIGMDFVAVEPYTTSILPIAIGQRYAVIIEANPRRVVPPVQDGNYWLRVNMLPTPGLDLCGKISPGQSTEAFGVIRYNMSNTELPTSMPHNYNPPDCSDDLSPVLHPVVPWEVGKSAANNVANDTFEAGIDDSQKYHDFYRWDLTKTPLWLNFSDPSILNLDKTKWTDEKAMITEPYINKWVYLIITSSGHPSLPKLSRGAHPIHLHGHDFAVLARSNKTYDNETSKASFNYSNPPRRDVITLPMNGYVAIAFKTDNPGVWLLHCHIAWHASSGLALQILERQDEIVPILGRSRLQATELTCGRWENWLRNHTIDQNDSGI